VIVTLVKLAFAGIRSRTLTSVITALLAATAASTIVVALEVGATARDPWQRTFDAANGAHVLVLVPMESDALAVTRQPGVAQADAPFPMAAVDVPIGGARERLFLAAIPPDATVNVPVDIHGTTAPGDGIVLERSFADALGLEVGDRLRLGDPAVELDVEGVAIVPSQARYPRSNPGLAWVTEPTLQALQPDRSQWRWTAAMRLTDTANAEQFAADASHIFPPGTVLPETWRDQRDNALLDAQLVSLILSMYAFVILAVALMVLGIVIGARASQQRREVALAKAIGLTPRQVAAMFTLETACVGVVGVALGSLVGFVAAPRLAAPVASTLLGAPEMAPNAAHAVIAAVPVLLVLVIGSWISTRRRSQRPVMQTLRPESDRPRRRSLLATISRLVGAPLTLTLGAKDLAAQRGRTRLLGAAMLTAAASFVFALCMKATLDRSSGEGVSDVPNELPALVYTIDAVLLVIAFATLVAVATFVVRERTREFGVMKTIGLTPRQVRHSMVGALAIISALSSVLAVPVGIALYSAVYGIVDSGSGQFTLAPWTWLLALPVVITAATALATDPLARLASNAPISDALHYE
jgi:putative ABC transport system permease protein